MPLRIRSSPGEIDIEGTTATFQRLESTLTAFIFDDLARSTVIDVESQFSPNPYTTVLSSFVVKKGNGKNDFRIRDGRLELSGSNASLSNFVDNLPFDAEPHDTVGYHIHYDYISSPVTESSPELVISLKGGT